MDLKMAFATSPIAMITLVATIYVTYQSFTSKQYWVDQFLLHPYSVYYHKEYKRLITHGFVHADYMHLAFNMLTFFFFAVPLERIVGSLNFIIIYFGSLVISGAISTYRRKDWEGFRSLGASGAVSGVLFSISLYLPNMELLVFFILPIKAWLFAILFVGVSWYLAQNRYSIIDHEAHLWGALTGAALTILLEPRVVSIFLNGIF